MIDPKCVDDANLIHDFKQGDKSAFDALFDRYRDGVYSLVYRTLGPAGAEDAAQDVFVQLYKSLHRFRGDAAFKTWLFRLTLNVCRDHIRRHSRQPVTCELSADSVGGDVDAGHGLTTGTAQDVESALLDLPEDERSLLELRYVQGFSHREISEMLGCNNGTVRTKIHRAIIRLRRRLLPASEEADKP